MEIDWIEVINILGWIIVAISILFPIYDRIVNKKENQITAISHTVGVALFIMGVVILVANNVFNSKNTLIPAIYSMSLHEAQAEVNSRELSYVLMNEDEYKNQGYSKEHYLVSLSKSYTVGDRVKKYTEIELIIVGVASDADKKNPDYSPQDNNISNESSATEKSDDTNYTIKNPDDLSIQIESFSYNDGFHYEYPDAENPSITYVTDLGAGISGTFTYSRPLTEYEIENGGHTGKIYDTSGNLIYEHAHCWSDQNGMFAFEFPNDLPSGTYYYELIRVAGEYWLTDRIQFSY